MKKIAACLILLWAVAPAAFAGSENPPAAPAQAQAPELGAAEQDLAAGNWAAARTKAKAAIKQNKKSPQAWIVLGRAFLAEGEPKKALRRFRKAVKRDPRHAPGYFWSGQAYEKLGKLDEAANEYQAALHADPGLEDAKTAWERLKDQVSSPES